MKLYLEKSTTAVHRIILGYDDSKYGEYLSDKKNTDLLKQRISAKKQLTLIDDEAGVCYVQVLKTDHKEMYLALEEARKAAYALYVSLKDRDATSVVLQNAGVSRDEYLAFCEGLYLTNYQFNKYKTRQDDPPFSIESLGLTDSQLKNADVLALEAVLEATSFTRDMVNEPLSYLTAARLAEEIRSKGKEAGFNVETFGKKKIESLRMGGLLAVNKGSIDPPTFSILEWKPEKPVNDKPYVLVGKGVVYDTGGLSLKPTSDSMDYMKSDMAGAAAVAGSFYAIARAGLPVHIIGLIPATDNRPDGNAYVPGDVVTMYDGSTVEVLNTDAEGRMILADALSYARQYDPELVIELSTLTGSAQLAVGNYAIVGMGNADQKEMKALVTSGFNTFERIAEFPFWDDFSELLKSDIADQKNIGGRYAGAITAGKFLEKFTDYPYIHLDIAGPSFNKTNDNYRGRGGSGVGVRLLFDFFKQKTS